MHAYTPAAAILILLTIGVTLGWLIASRYTPPAAGEEVNTPAPDTPGESPAVATGGRLARIGLPDSHAQPAWATRHQPLAPRPPVSVQLRNAVQPLGIVETPPRRHSARHHEGIPVATLLAHRWPNGRAVERTTYLPAVAR